MFAPKDDAKNKMSMISIFHLYEEKSIIIRKKGTKKGKEKRETEREKNAFYKYII